MCKVRLKVLGTGTDFWNFNFSLKSNNMVNLGVEKEEEIKYNNIYNI
jgi:hypothetical protein